MSTLNSPKRCNDTVSTMSTPERPTEVAKSDGERKIKQRRLEIPSSPQHCRCPERPVRECDGGIEFAVEEVDAAPEAWWPPVHTTFLSAAFKPPDVPRDERLHLNVAIAIDCTQSMNVSGAAKALINQIRSLPKVFHKILENASDAYSRSVSFSLFQFGKHARAFYTVGTDFCTIEQLPAMCDAVANELRFFDLKADYEAMINYASAVFCAKMQEQREDGRTGVQYVPCLVVVTDSPVGLGATQDPKRLASRLDGNLSDFLAMPVPIYAIGIGEVIDASILTGMVANRGFFAHASDVKDTRSAFTNVFEAILLADEFATFCITSCIRREEEEVPDSRLESVMHGALFSKMTRRARMLQVAVSTNRQPGDTFECSVWFGVCKHASVRATVPVADDSRVSSGTVFGLYNEAVQTEAAYNEACKCVELLMHFDPCMETRVHDDVVATYHAHRYKQIVQNSIPYSFGQKRMMMDPVEHRLVEVARQNDTIPKLSILSRLSV